MPNNPHRQLHYKCSECGREVGKDNLRAKRVQFKDISANGRIHKSRMVAWLCTVPQPDGRLSCLDRDPDWQRPLYATAPGMADTSIAESV